MKDELMQKLREKVQPVRSSFLLSLTHSVDMQTCPKTYYKQVPNTSFFTFSQTKQQLAKRHATNLVHQF